MALFKTKIFLLFATVILSSCISKNFQTGQETTSLKSFLKKAEVSDEGIKELFAYLPDKSPEEADGSFFAEKDILSMNESVILPIPENSGLIVLGFCPNGDFVAMDMFLNKGTIYYICHETVHKLVTSFEDHSIKVADSPNDYKTKLLEIEDFPYDFSEACRKLKNSPYVGYHNPKNKKLYEELQKELEAELKERQKNLPKDEGDPFAAP